MLKAVLKKTKNKKGGEIVQTILVTAVFLVLAILLGVWISTTVNTELDRMKKVEAGEEVEPRTEPIEPPIRIEF